VITNALPRLSTLGTVVNQIIRVMSWYKYRRCQKFICPVWVFPLLVSISVQAFAHIHFASRIPGHSFYCTSNPLSSCLMEIRNWAYCLLRSLLSQEEINIVSRKKNLCIFISWTMIELRACMSITLYKPVKCIQAWFPLDWFPQNINKVHSLWTVIAGRNILFKILDPILFSPLMP
jgi:hypothetical protein